MRGDTTGTPAQERGRVRAVALPSEHGGWGLTIEPGLLGLLVAPSLAGLCLAVAAVLAFVARTPVKIVLVDAFRRRFLPRTRVALTVSLVEVVVLLVLVAGTGTTATANDWWLPALVAGPLIAIELWYDMRSRSRRLVPELAGSVGVAGVTAMIVLAEGESSAVAVGLWIVLAARAISSITWVRVQVMMMRGRPVEPGESAWADVVAAAAVGGAVMMRGELILGAAAVTALIVIQRLEARGEPMPVKKIGIQQMVFGFGVVLITAVGVWVM